MSLRIPLAQPEVTEQDREAVLEVLRTPDLSSGPKVREFEQAVCDYTGARHAVAVNSGTSALCLAVRALRLEPGAEVILPSFSFPALLNVILKESLRPRFVDVAEGSFNPTPELIAGALTPQTRLVLAVHTFGFPVDIRAVADALGAATSRARRPRQTIHVIEDACEALGGEIHGCKAGTLGEAGLFAFYPNKQITTGEGGMLITGNEQLAARARQLRNQGRHPAHGWYDHSEIGFSYRLSDMNCALGISQLRRIETIRDKRQALAEVYDRELAGIPDVIRPPGDSSVGRISWFVYPILLASQFTAADRDRICESLAQRGIGTGRYFAPLHLQPVLRSTQEPIGNVDLPNTESVAGRIIALPFFNRLSRAEVQEVCGALDESVRERRRKT